MDPVDQLSFAEVLVRLAVATAIGSALGIERRLHEKPAGMRTHAMVALGSALFALIGLHLERAGGTGDLALGHVVQGVITGIGFLGAGVILRDRQTLTTGADRQSVHGLTTAASVWAVAGLGLACGAGYWRVGLIALVLALIVLVLGGRIEDFVNGQFSLAKRRSKFVNWLLEDPAPPNSPSG